jgi:galactokinase
MALVREPELQRARDAFAAAFGADRRPQLVAAPGRINLIGEHTDYNDGFVLPMAIDRYVTIAFAPRPDQILRAHAAEFGQVREVSLEALRQRTHTAPDDPGERGGWFNYVAGVAWAMLGASQAIRGADLAIVSEVPIGAGLSSSAAVEIGVARALSAVSDVEWDPATAARQAQRAEHEFAGVACGIMDQLSIAAARDGCALLIDCRSLSTQDVPVPSAARLVVFDTGVRRELASVAYNDRRAACERVVAAVQAVEPPVRALRDVDEPLLAHVAPTLDAVDARRAAHVIAENRRPSALANAFADGKLTRAGQLMRESHASLRDLYEVSCPELDAIVDLASAQVGCFGARLTGAGFGGCAIALVEADAVNRVIAATQAGYQQRTGRTAVAFATRAVGGAGIV